jgi:DNA mismatch repair protein MutL
MPIRRLDELTVGKIAAGEVIERPAAAVKELVENALDAGARRIDVALAGGGVDLIEVRDDGQGIAFDDLPLAVERHATSKLGTIDDLDRLGTLGFRGEGLSSLAAVSDLTIHTSGGDGANPGMLRVRHGMLTDHQNASWGSGTTIVARDLFANVPARRKFLRAPATESGYVARMVSAYALAYPAVAFSFESDGRRTFATDGSGSSISAGLAVWGRELGEELVAVEPLVDDERTHEGYRVRGVISLPTVNRATRQQQFIFAQGRLIVSRQLATAFEQAYHTLLMVGRHPLGCLLIDVPPNRIDVNIHPTKSEVRFADERLVFALVQRAVRETLLRHTRHQSVPTIIRAPLAASSPASDFQRRLNLANPSRVSSAGTWSAGSDSSQPVEPDSARAVPVLRVLGQVASSFIVAEGPDGLYLVDQHAAHERVLFEQLWNGREGRSIDQQRLLTPAVVELSPRQQEIFQQCRDDLQRIGFEVDDFGSGSAVVRAVPALLKITNPVAALQEMLNELAEGGRGQDRLESLTIGAACHGSIRAGQPLSLLEMRELVVQLEACASPRACGHGRPTIIRMTADELERQFQRR